MSNPRIRSLWGRMALALGVFLVFTTFFAVVVLVTYLAGEGKLPTTPEAARSPEVRAELERVMEEPRFLVGMLFGQALGGIATVILLTLGVDRRPFGDLGTRGGTRWAGGVGWGLLLGAVLASVVVLFVSAAGGRHLHAELFAGVGWRWAPLTTVAVLLAAFMEEWFLRGYLWANLRETYTAGRTIFFTTLLFAFLHSANPGTGFLGWLNIYLIGIVLGQLREVSGGVPVPIGLHAAWNLMMGMVLGARVSGLVFPSVLRVSLEDLPLALGGGPFGPEGSAVTTILFGGIAVLLGKRMAAASAGDVPFR